MKNFKVSRAKLILLILVLLLIVLAVLFITNTKVINNLFGIEIKQEDEEILPLFSYVVYDNQDKEKIKVLITVNSNDGIEYIEYPNGEKLNGNGKNTVAIDYLAKENENYTFGIKEINKAKEDKEMVINNNTTQDTTLGINIVTNMLGYKAAKIENKMYLENYEVYYKIGTNGEWVNSTELSSTDYDLIQNGLVDVDGTTTITAKIENTQTNNIVTVSDKVEIDETQVNESIQADSLLKAIELNDIKTGKYEVTVSGEVYNLKVHNIDSSLEMSMNTQIGVEEDVGAANKYAQNMVVLKVNGDLTIGENTTLTSYASKDGYGGTKGMMIYCTGTITNKGTISMTSRGAYAEGDNVYLWKNASYTDESKKYEYVPIEGASGGNSVGTRRNKGFILGGENGHSGKDRQTGGGGSGACGSSNDSSVYSGSGTVGTSYCGGTRRWFCLYRRSILQ